MKEEKDCQLPFLAVLVCREDGGELKTTFCRKETYTSRILSYLRNHPVSHERSCVRTLYRRVETHYREPADQKAEVQYLRKIFTMNAHSGAFVEKCRQRGPYEENQRDSQNRHAGEQYPITGQPEPTRWRAIPYIAGVSEEYARLFSEFGIGVAHRPEATIRRQLMLPKDPEPVNEKSSVIYRIDCLCGEAKYVGETGKRVLRGIHQHELAVRRNDKLPLVVVHASMPGHGFNFERVQILGRSDDRTSRLLQKA
ncbi:unnamed protein product [Dibothriocephalus latus]|uniref:Helix-turn-helix domain-containing protein n=1 Tax=Dibothriocephalus latus TaxID=60516 RepID=A0A3P6S2S7_DIBLA|nr:unnamed protein product [Dibothriocephalus latus]